MDSPPSQLLPQSGVGIFLLAHLTRLAVWLTSILLPTIPCLRSLVLWLVRTSADVSGLAYFTKIVCPVLARLNQLTSWPVVRSTRAPGLLQTLDAPPALWYDLRHATSAPLIPPVIVVYVHGGGFCTHMHTDPLFAAAVLPRLAARGIPARVLSLDYSVAPVSRDVQLAQLLHAWTQLASHTHTDTVLVLAGDSAGGHLVTAMVHALCCNHEPDELGAASSRPSRLPDVLIAISPWLAVEEEPPQAPSRAPSSTPSRVHNSARGTDYLTARLLTVFASTANHGANHMLPPAPDEPIAEHAGAVPSVHGALLSGQPLRRPWPTTGIWVGGGEVLADDGRRLAAALARSCFQPPVARTYAPHGHGRGSTPTRRSASPARANSGLVDDGCRHANGSDSGNGQGLQDSVGRRVELFDLRDAVHDWPLLPWFDVRRGDAARGMDALVGFVCNACRDLLGSEAGYLIHC